MHRPRRASQPRRLNALALSIHVTPDGSATVWETFTHARPVTHSTSNQIAGPFDTRAEAQEWIDEQ